MGSSHLEVSLFVIICFSMCLQWNAAIIVAHKCFLATPSPWDARYRHDTKRNGHVCYIYGRFLYIYWPINCINCIYLNVIPPYITVLYHALHSETANRSSKIFGKHQHKHKSSLQMWSDPKQTVKRILAALDAYQDIAGSALGYIRILIQPAIPYIQGYISAYIRICFDIF